MTSSQSAVSYSDQQLSKSYQQMSREAQEMKRRRRRRFQSQVTVEEADVSYYSRSCRQLPFISTVDESVSSRVYKLTTANVTVKNDGNQQMVRVQQMKIDQLLCKQALKQREIWISDDDISSDVITTSSAIEEELDVVRPESCCHTEKKINRRQQQRENESEVKLSTTILERA
ncbi:hypothetical protein F511_31951 [Dorcoceras hygrometricum]|uniref:Uncharacterized protein n=1 Tax=Dorcoceras hygrometricum TaxID=472368 RepID=A0A2Z7ADS8_9LAMI|nr:hypothetical protein F511_31951 [Dorcoceras hygrometricum]